VRDHRMLLAHLVGAHVLRSANFFANSRLRSIKSTSSAQPGAIRSTIQYL
jgi:hypothetical protein